MASTGKSSCQNTAHNAIEISLKTMDKGGEKRVNLESSTGPSFSFESISNGVLIIKLRGPRSLISMPKKCQNFMECDKVSELSNSFVGDTNGDGGPTFMDDFYGLWHLGLDLLPLDNTKTEITYQNLCSTESEKWDVAIRNNVTLLFSTKETTNKDRSLFSTAETMNTSKNFSLLTTTTETTNKATSLFTITSETTTETMRTPPEITPNTPEVAKLIWENLDLSYDPCNDFFGFACGGGKPIPEDADMQLSPEILALHNELMTPNKSDSKTEHKLKEVYKICWNECTENGGKHHDASKEIDTQLMTKIGGLPAIVGRKWKSKFIKKDKSNQAKFTLKKQFWKMIGELASQHGISCFMDSHYEVAHESSSSRNVIMFTQPIYTYPPQRVMVEKALADWLKQDVEQIFGLMIAFGGAINPKMNETYAGQAVTEMMELKMQMAMAMVSQEMFHEVRHYRTYKISDLYHDYPSISWEALLDGMGILEILKKFENEHNEHDSYSVIIAHPSYFAVLNTLFQGHQWAENRAIFDYIGHQILEANYQFVVPPNTTDPYPNSNRTIGKCLSYLEQFFPNGIGYAYVKLVENRNAIVADVKKENDLIFKAFRESLDSIEWISPESKEIAHDKLLKMARNIGWPEDLYGDFKDTTKLDQHQRHYLELEPKTPWFAAQQQLIKALRATAIEWFQKPVNNANIITDKVSPFTKNAFYDATSNSLIVTLHYLTLPIYNIDFPPWYNYASQGSVVGHELSHGFDSNGVQYGSMGEHSCDLFECGWMDPNSTKAFNEMSQCVARYYADQCCPFDEGPVRCVDGEFTLAENQADIAGAQTAYYAYQKYKDNDKKGTDHPRIKDLEQFSDNQLFWIAYAQYWCHVSRQHELSVGDIFIDPHSPDYCRVNQVLQNIPAFGEDFECNWGKRMYPEGRCKVWTGI